MVAGTDNTPDGGTPADGSAETGRPTDALGDLLNRLPKAKLTGASRASTTVDAPLRTNREYRGGAMPEPVPAPPAPRASATETIERPSAPVHEPEVENRIRGQILPGRARGLSTGRMIWFLVAFVAPVILGSLYIFFIMPDEYITEFRFSVRVPVGNAGAVGQTSSGSSVSALFGGNPTPGTDLLDNFTVADYVRSPQAARDLNAKLQLKTMYNRPADPLSRLGDLASQERLGRYWQGMVYSDYDVTTGLAVVRVKGFTAQDSLSIANGLLASANKLVNDIGDQSQGDTVRFAREQLNRATEQVTTLQGRLGVLSRQGGVDSPSVGVTQANTQIATTTRTNIAQLQSEIQILRTQLHNSDAPQIVLLQQELAANQRALADAVGTSNNAATNNYAILTTQLANANTVLSSAQAALSYAQATAAAQRLYLTTYVRPTLADSPVAPDRWMDLLLLVVVAGMAWLVGMLVRNSILEHGL
jgi:capsular polysaccharide transport system permease protein